MAPSNSTFDPIQTGRLYEQIVRQIENQIVSGELRAGDKLPTEHELAEQFGVSRTSVREAMKALVQKGLVDVKPGRGSFVINGTSQVVKRSLGLMVRFDQDGGLPQLVEVREILEPEIAARAALRATEQTISALQKEVEVMDANMDDPETYIAADHRFHRALAEGTQNALILALADSIVELLQEQRMRIYHVEGGPERGQYHHKRILEAVAARDPADARAAMQAHLRQIREDSAASALAEE